MNFLNGRIAKHNDGLAFEEGSCTIAIPAQFQDALVPFTDKPLVFGIRPEDVGSDTAEHDSPVYIRASVDVVEPMGSETMLYMHTEDNTFISRIDPHRTCHAGDEMDLALDMDKAHFFEPGTEKVVA